MGPRLIRRIVVGNAAHVTVDKNVRRQLKRLTRELEATVVQQNLLEWEASRTEHAGRNLALIAVCMARRIVSHRSVRYSDTDFVSIASFLSKTVALFRKHGTDVNSETQDTWAEFSSLIDRNLRQHHAEPWYRECVFRTLHNGDEWRCPQAFPPFLADFLAEARAHTSPPQ